MYVDIGGALAPDADPGIAREELDALDERVADAHERIESGMQGREFGYTALALPERVDLDALEKAVAPLADAEYVLTVGIGGSALGARTITSGLAPRAAERHVVLDNVDPEHVERVLDGLPLAETVVNVVSKSGTTAETLANFLIVREAMADAGVDWTERTIATTGTSGPLRSLADEHDLPTRPVPDGVPGRFAALSPVGLGPAAGLGCDLAGLLEGAQEAKASLAPSLFDCPAYAYGATAYALEERGASVNAFMPYAEQLEPFAEWFAQLWAESLGKEGRGQTPARALGATDQHSQLQLYRAGPDDKLVTIVDADEREGPTIPESDHEELSYLGDTDLAALLAAERKATAASLGEVGQPTVRVGVEQLDARALGELLYGMEAATILVGELAEIETFTQPAVEWGKRAARALLAGEETDETATIAEQRELRIE